MSQDQNLQTHSPSKSVQLKAIEPLAAEGYAHINGVDAGCACGRGECGDIAGWVFDLSGHGGGCYGCSGFGVGEGRGDENEVADCVAVLLAYDGPSSIRARAVCLVSARVMVLVLVDWLANVRIVESRNRQVAGRPLPEVGRYFAPSSNRMKSATEDLSVEAHRA
jgi:hypothetical protein